MQLRAKLSKLLAFFTLASFVTAHFSLDYPPSRGFNEDIEPQFCGGFPFTNRSLFPLNGGMIEIDSHHANAVFVTLISLSQDPQNFSDFSSTYLIPFVQLSGTGELCLPADVASLNLPNVTDGTNATIMVQYTSGSEALYQCADVTLTSNASDVSVRPCTNVSSVASVASTNDTVAVFSSLAAVSASAASTAAIPTQTKSDASHLTPVAGLAFAAALVAALL